eukprot:TRINITY_DN8438_c0_g1_i1.p1 TRINITY_DN8438_c0_g1~~TRINITY_DN8438_c0_g1_i1.p1  ORF type:complete len:543 (+),score=153.38 TRINITY_DN8438_c0_g1_i1:74-1630(+)
MLHTLVRRSRWLTSAAGQAEITKGLNELQMAAYRKVQCGGNLLLMGAAGTGKSHVTRAMRAGMLASGRNVACCAPFGVAACNVDGFTIHSTFGINVNDFSTYSNLPDQDTPTGRKLRDKIAKNSWRHRKKLWEVLDTLFIDEISTCDKNTITILDHMGRLFKEVNEPFGGIQVVAVGDFLQLPPVNGAWAFESPVFNEIFNDSSVIQLHEVIRQNTDTEYTETLNFIRTLHPDDRTAIMYAKELLKQTCHVELEPPADSTRLVPLTRMALAHNSKQLAALNHPEFIYTAFDSEKPRLDLDMATMFKNMTGESVKRKKDDAHVVQALDAMLNRGRIDAELVLKKGARVMHLFNNAKGILNKNSSEKVVNGHTGVVVGFDRPPSSQETADYRLWAAKRRELRLPVEIPVVRWDHSDFKSYVQPIKWSVGDIWNTHCYVKDRIQLPLALCWAITAHKCQGMTVEGKVSVSLASSFAPGQGYVSLSRSKSGSVTYVDGINSSNKGFSASPAALNYLGIKTIL